MIDTGQGEHPVGSKLLKIDLHQTAKVSSGKNSWFWRTVQMGTRRRKIAPIVFSIATFNIAAIIPAIADMQSARRGRAFAQANCSHCHSVDRSTRSPHRAAPPFRTLHKRYPVETLGDALAEGISTGHPRMPEFRLEPGQVGDFIDFLKPLE